MTEIMRGILCSMRKQEIDLRLRLTRTLEVSFLDMMTTDISLTATRNNTTPSQLSAPLSHRCLFPQERGTRAIIAYFEGKIC